MNKKSLSIIGIGAAAVALSAGAVAFAASDNQPAASTTTSQSQTYDKGPGMGETALTGAEAEKVTAAAQAEIPDGTVLRVETDSEGVYEAHVTKADGTEVIRWHRGDRAGQCRLPGHRRAGDDGPRHGRSSRRTGHGRDPADRC
ncbi:MAG: hypothetical protein MUF33_09320 [Candidatus Nanopelagicales bacterium]|nr:hypothetical protein [Candidatus Nanopelagicales bacterium]